MWTQVAFALVLLVGAVSCFPETRVINGTTADVNDYPFMVSLRWFHSHACGATIIAPRWILTAAHCVNTRRTIDLSIQYGVTRIAASGPNVIGVKRILVHQNYVPARSEANDIALLELKDKLVFNYKTIMAVTLPEPYFEIDQVAEGAPGVLIGWGSNTTDGQMAQSNLQMVDLKIYSDAECNSRHNNATIVDQICGGVDEGGKGQCSRDSGSPLLIRKSVQLGIVSWSRKPCTMAPYPGVYTKVSHYIDWIKRNMNETCISI